MEKDKREELRKKLKDNIKNKEILRSNKDVKAKVTDNTIIDDNLKNLGISDMNELKNYMESIKDINPDLLLKQLQSLGITQEQMVNFLETLKK